jgi:hypothetical protein
MFREATLAVIFPAVGPGVSAERQPVIAPWQPIREALTDHARTIHAPY